MEKFKRDHWRSWFIGSIPALNNMSPKQAAQTESGRRLVNNLLNEYDGLREAARDGTSMDANVPSAWVRWKLNFPGSPPNGETLFAEEERIFKGTDSPAYLAQIMGTKDVEGGKSICNYCLKDDKDLLVCSRCRARRYCSKDCQKQDWSDHKKYCKESANEALASQKAAKKEYKKLSPVERWESLKGMVTGHHANYIAKVTGTGIGTGTGTGTGAATFSPSWRQLLDYAVKDGVIDRSIVEADEKGEKVALSEELSKSLSEVLTRLRATHLLQSQSQSQPQSQPDINKLESAYKTLGGAAREGRDLNKMRKAFGGVLRPHVYKQLPQREATITLTFSCVMLNKKTGMKEFYVSAIWTPCNDEFGPDAYQSVFMHAPVLSHTKPSVVDLAFAIDCAITAPSGIQFGTNIPHRPKFITIHNRWGRECYDALRFQLYAADINSHFQSREDAERECAEEGTDPDGINLIFS